MTRPVTTIWPTIVLFGISALVLAALLVCGGIASACNVPVFRYALERWQPDPYRLTLFHRGALSEAQQALLDPLEGAPSDQVSTNVGLRMVEVDQIEDEADRALFEATSSSGLPRLVVQYPQGLRIEEPVLVDTLSEQSVARVVDSPLRGELVRRLSDGQTAVWLMLECGQADKDDAVAEQLMAQLEQLEKRLQLPELTSAPEDALLSTAPLRVTFSLLRVPRGLASERSLVEMLLGSESDLTEFDEPMVFPVFGRGRALLPLIGAGITSDNVEESASFLVGACSCEVKELNPGFDLLLAANWDVLLFKEAPPADVVAARAPVSSGEPELVPIPSGAPSAPAILPSESTAELPYEPTYVAGIALVGLLLAGAVMIGFKRFA